MLQLVWPTCNQNAALETPLVPAEPILTSDDRSSDAHATQCAGSN